jgi:hypothetical protein
MPTQDLKEVRQKLADLSTEAKKNPELHKRVQEHFDGVLAERGISEPLIKELRRERSPGGEPAGCFVVSCVCSNCNVLTVSSV